MARMPEFVFQITPNLENPLQWRLTSMEILLLSVKPRVVFLSVNAIEKSRDRAVHDLNAEL